VIQDLSGKIDGIVRGEDCRVGIESTVLDISGKTPVILRPGIITAENIESAIGEKVELDPALHNREGLSEDGDSQTPKSPGMKYKHYAPQAQMMVLEGQQDKVKAEIQRLKGLNESLGNKVGVILFEEQAFIEAAHNFFADLRELDQQGVDLILAGALSDKDGLGFAVMNRMMKSAGYNIVTVK
jgi:L-threonylcarbamoyladenylate synthase